MARYPPNTEAARLSRNPPRESDRPDWLASGFDKFSRQQPPRSRQCETGASAKPPALGRAKLFWKLSPMSLARSQRKRRSHFETLVEHYRAGLRAFRDFGRFVRDDEQSVGLRHRSQRSGALQAGQPRREIAVGAAANDRAQKVSQLRGDLDVFVEGHCDGPAKERGVSLHLPQRRTDEELEAHHRRDRITGHADPRRAIQQTEREGRS